MPISNVVAPYGQYVVGNVLKILPILDDNGQLVYEVDGYVGLSYPFHVVDQPMTLVAADFRQFGLNDDVVLVQVTPDGETWQDLWLHGTQVKLSPENTLVHLSVPGMYRLARLGWFKPDPDNLPDEPLGKATVCGWYGTLTHEPDVPMTPDVGAQGPQGAQGVQGVIGRPTTALFIIAPTAPDVTLYDHGSAWWDSDNGRTYILYDDGSSKQWVEFIGSTGTANFIISPVAPPLMQYTPGSAWWDLDNGRAYILYDDGSSRQWVEFIGSSSQAAIIQELMDRVVALEAKVK